MLNTPSNKACNGRVGFCGIPNYFSGFKFSCSQTRRFTAVHVRPGCQACRDIRRYPTRCTHFVQGRCRKPLVCNSYINYADRFERLMTNMDDTSLKFMGGYNVPEKMGIPCELKILFGILDDSVNGFVF